VASRCPAEDNASVTIHGATLTFTNGVLKQFAISFYPSQDGRRERDVSSDILCVPHNYFVNCLTPCLASKRHSGISVSNPTTVTTITMMTTLGSLKLLATTSAAVTLRCPVLRSASRKRAQPDLRPAPPLEPA